MIESKQEAIEKINVATINIRFVRDHIKNLIEKHILIDDFSELLVKPLYAVEDTLDDAHDFIQEEVLDDREE